MHSNSVLNTEDHNAYSSSEQGPESQSFTQRATLTFEEDGETVQSQRYATRVQSILRCYDLWFEDGSIVLRAQNPATLFRIHKAILARHSEVFRNMFAFPQPQPTVSRPRPLARLGHDHDHHRQTQDLESLSSSTSFQQKTVKHHRISQSVDFVKEPVGRLRTMGSLSRRLSTLTIKTLPMASGSNPFVIATSNDNDNKNGDDGLKDVDSDDGDGLDGNLRDSYDTDNTVADIVDEATAERIEGCDVIDMHDSSFDLANFLRAIYDGPQWTDNSPADFAIVSGVLRLAHKYLVDNLRSKALEHLHQAWPTTLQGWDLREDRAWAYSSAGNGNSTGSTVVGAGQREWNAEGRFPHPISVINLARNVNAPSLLPSAFYDLSRLTFFQLFDGLSAQMLNMDSAFFSPDLQNLAIGKEQSHQAVTSLITNLGNVRCSITGGGGGSGVKMWCCALTHTGSSNSNAHPTAVSRPSRSKSQHAHCHSTCHSPVSCRRDFTELVELSTQHYLFDRERGHTDPLYVAEELGQLKSAECSECKACAVALECWSMRERERIWRCLPGWFRVGAGWESLM